MAGKEQAATVPVRDKYRALVRQLGQLTQEYTARRIDAWFEDIEEVLLSASEMAMDNAAQLRFMEAMGPLRGARGTFGQRFPGVL